ncbi:MAG: ParB/RepB/Spo0J family partition protein [Ruminococcus sp.]|nr:ParB/RepB/Spo0J family partition protein [Oscillospiraceae bacterium]MBR2723983.1 ParB/RepB/Spo0J family partition protein [Ruminococcus sp.]
MAKRIGGLAEGMGLDKLFGENEIESGSALTLRIEEIEPNRDQPRTEFDDEALLQLSESIRENGVLQPILVRPIFGGGYQIVAGERRYRASLMAGLTEIPVIIRSLDDKKTMELALIENLQRENLNPVEEAMGYRTLMEGYNMTQEEVATSVGKSRPAIANALRILKLPEYVLALVSEGKLSAGHARALAAIDDPEKICALAEEIVEKGLSVRFAEQAAKPEKEKKVREKEKTPKPNYYKEVEIALTESLGRKISVSKTKNGKGGALTIEFYSDDELKSFANLLGRFN